MLSILGLRSSRLRTDIKLGYACNNNCRFCIIGDRRHSHAYREFKEIKKEIDIASGSDKIVITGGEPTIHPSFFEVLEYAKMVGFETIHVESNGRMWSNKAFLLKVMEYANSFSVSLHAHNEELYAKLTGTDHKSFGQVISGLRNLASKTDKISVNTTIIKENYMHLEEIVGLVHSLKIKQINFPFVNPGGYAWDNKIHTVPKLSEIRPYLHKAFDYADQNSMTATTEMIPFCMMGGHENKVMEQFLPHMEISAPDYRDESFENTRRLKGRTKPDSCAKCPMDNKCEGVTTGYAEIYGTDELVWKKE